MAIKKRTPDKPCSIPECWQPARCAGMCSACYQWWHRVSIYSAQELTDYLRRLRRFGSRAGLLGTRQSMKQRPNLRLASERRRAS